MRRRTWLKVGVAGGALLAIGGGTIALVQPAWQEQRLLEPARRVFRALARGFLDGTLPAAAPEQTAALEGFLDRVQVLIAALPAHAQQELAQLLALLSSPFGRVAFAGLDPDWPAASAAQLQQALQGLRVSSVALRRQAYQALHDITGAAYFSSEDTWEVLGYPGPIEL